MIAEHNNNRFGLKKKLGRCVTFLILCTSYHKISSLKQQTIMLAISMG